jgi:hypothetical protein
MTQTWTLPPKRPFRRTAAALLLAVPLLVASLTIGAVSAVLMPLAARSARRAHARAVHPAVRSRVPRQRVGVLRAPRTSPRTP